MATIYSRELIQKQVSAFLAVHAELGVIEELYRAKREYVAYVWRTYTRAPGEYCVPPVTKLLAAIQQLHDNFHHGESLEDSYVEILVNFVDFFYPDEPAGGASRGFPEYYRLASLVCNLCTEIMGNVLIEDVSDGSETLDWLE